MPVRTIPPRHSISRMPPTLTDTTRDSADTGAIRLSTELERPADSAGECAAQVRVRPAQVGDIGGEHIDLRERVRHAGAGAEIVDAEHAVVLRQKRRRVDFAWRRQFPHPAEPEPTVRALPRREPAHAKLPRE